MLKLSLLYNIIASFLR